MHSFIACNHQLILLQNNIVLASMLTAWQQGAKLIVATGSQSVMLYFNKNVWYEESNLPEKKLGFQTWSIKSNIKTYV